MAFSVDADGDVQTVYTPRNDEVMLRWAYELESGKYNQGTGALRDMKDRFCCLGVLCEMAANEGLIPPAKREDEDGLFHYGDYETAFLPRVVRKWAFGDADETLIDMDGEEQSPVDLNDSYHYTFRDIAAAIRKTVEADKA